MDGGSTSSSVDADASLQQPAQAAEESQEWLDQQLGDPDDDRGASDDTASASVQPAAWTELDAQAKRQRLPRGASGAVDLPVEVRSSFNGGMLGLGPTCTHTKSALVYLKRHHHTINEYCRHKTPRRRTSLQKLSRAGSLPLAHIVRQTACINLPCASSLMTRREQVTAIGPISVEASGIAEDGHTGRAPKRVKGQERPMQELAIDFVDPREVGASARCCAC